MHSNNTQIFIVNCLLYPFTVPGRYTISFIQEMGRVGCFLFQGSIHIFSFPIQVSKIIQQIYFIGMKSMFVICLTGIFTGMVLGLQGYYTLSKFGAEGLLGSAVALSLIRELGPVLTAIMVIGRAGSAMAAETGIMRISEQIDALDTMDINLIRFMVSPRIAASLISFSASDSHIYRIRNLGRVSDRVSSAGTE